MRTPGSAGTGMRPAADVQTGTGTLCTDIRKWAYKRCVLAAYLRSRRVEMLREKRHSRNLDLLNVPLDRCLSPAR